MNEIAAINNQTAMQSYSVNEVKAQVQQVQNLMKDLMKEGEHYGHSFPGDTKKNLLKPGADKLMFMFRLRSDFTQEIKELPNGHREVLTHCYVYHIESGNKIAEGVGSASTMESKFRYRNDKRKCPLCGAEAIIQGRKEYGGGYICFGKKGGCGAKFAENDPEIVNQKTGKIENPDIADCYNTVLKMSKKRAYVDATITATAASDIFTQDLEDIMPEESATPEQKKDLDQYIEKNKTKESEIDRLKREAWNLIKRLPEKERTTWTESLKGADKNTLLEAIKDIQKELAEQEAIEAEKREAASEARAEHGRSDAEIEIY